MPAIRPMLGYLFRRRIPRLLLSGGILLLAALAIIWLKGNQPPPPPPNPPFPFQPGSADGNMYALGDYSGEPWLRVRSVSSDWRHLTVDQYIRYGIFDTEQRRFVASWDYSMSAPGQIPWSTLGWFSSPWTLDSAVMRFTVRREAKGGPLTRLVNPNRTRFGADDEYIYEVNIRDRKLRLLYQQNARKVLTSGVGKYAFSADRRLFACRISRSLRFWYTFEFVASDYQTDHRAVVPCSVFSLPKSDAIHLAITGWLPGTRSLLLQLLGSDEDGSLYRFFRIWAFYLMDPFREKLPKRFPVVEAFETLRKQGRLKPDEVEPVRVQAFSPPASSQTVRLAVSFCSTRSSTATAVVYRSSIWDLDLTDGRLRRVLDLGTTPHPYSHMIASPSQRAFVAMVASSATVITPNPSPIFSWVPVDLLYCDIHGEPKILPFRANSRRSLPSLSESLVFIDDNTLAYTALPGELRRFDLRTNRSELLYRIAPRLIGWFDGVKWRIEEESSTTPVASSYRIATRGPLTGLYESPDTSASLSAKPAGPGLYGPSTYFAPGAPSLPPSLPNVLSTVPIVPQMPPSIPPFPADAVGTAPIWVIMPPEALEWEARQSRVRFSFDSHPSTSPSMLGLILRALAGPTSDTANHDAATTGAAPPASRPSAPSLEETSDSLGK